MQGVTILRGEPHELLPGLAAALARPRCIKATGPRPEMRALQQRVDHALAGGRARGWCCIRGIC
jgi:hypothetical protein